MFPSASFAVLLDFAKGQRPWSADVLDAAADILKWTYRAFVEKGNPVAIGDSPTLEFSGSVDALEKFGAAAQDMDAGAVTGIITPALVSFVVQYLAQLLLEKIVKK